MKNTFYFTLKALFILTCLKFYHDLFGHVGKRPEEKAKVNYKIYDFIKWENNDMIRQYLVS